MSSFISSTNNNNCSQETENENIDILFNNINSNKKLSSKTSPVEYMKSPLAISNNSNTNNDQQITFSSPHIDLNISENSDFALISNISNISPVLETTSSLSLLAENNNENNSDNNNFDNIEVKDEETETEEQRLDREQRESELLAWEMMREESNEIYQMQMQFMRENMSGMSEEDIQALSEAINESGRPDLLAPNPNPDLNSEEESEDEGDEEDEDNPDNWDYDRLLQLGQQIGDVKTERWRLRANNVIESLPNAFYSDYCVEVNSSCESEENSHKRSKTCERNKDYRCAICMDPFEQSDQLSILPCKHFFHKDPCTKGWLADHNSCPNCKAKVSATP